MQNMQPVVTVALVVLALCTGVASAQVDDSIAISLSPSSAHLNSGEPVAINIAVTNVSSSPRYLGRNVIGPLQYDVRSASGPILPCVTSDPPAPLPKPQGEEDLVWLQPGTTMHFTQRLSQKDLCMSTPGTYYVSALLIGYIGTEARRKSRTLDVFSSWSKPIKVVIHPH